MSMTLLSPFKKQQLKDQSREKTLYHMITQIKNNDLRPSKFLKSRVKSGTENNDKSLNG